jgi:adenine-specific DNA-methyltransferase
LVPIKDLEKMLSSYAIDNKVIIKKISYRTYKNLRKSKKSDNLFEYLLYIKKNNTIIKSPLNYSGSKNNLMTQINKFLPGHIESFVDVMGGAFNVGVNVVAEEVIYNDYNKYVYEVISELLSTKSTTVIDHVKKQIFNYKLSRGNSRTYNIFRDYYNKNQHPLDLFVLSMFTFQNQLRFNSSHKFNTPVGNCSYNETLEKRITGFKPKTKKIKLMNVNFETMDYKKFSKGSLFYFDPPYFITNGSYNDGKRGFNGWDADLETKLLEYITQLHHDGYRFMLSNIISHRGKTNHILKEWIDVHKFNVSELQSGIRKEVLITNYKLNYGIR